MEINLSYIAGSGLKYGALVGGIDYILTLDSPQNLFAAGLCGGLYVAGELMQKNIKEKELKNLENKINGIKK
ncbi:MAG: hypothetical protein AABX80_00340 [Nanoarchaeota archaeon]